MYLALVAIGIGICRSMGFGARQIAGAARMPALAEESMALERGSKACLIMPPKVNDVSYIYLYLITDNDKQTKHKLSRKW